MSDERSAILQHLIRVRSEIAGIAQLYEEHQQPQSHGKRYIATARATSYSASQQRLRSSRSPGTFLRRQLHSLSPTGPSLACWIPTDTVGALMTFSTNPLKPKLVGAPHGYLIKYNII